MTYVKVLHTDVADDRWLTAGSDAFALHVAATVWRDRQFTDGRIPKPIARRGAPATIAPDETAAPIEALLEAGFWTDDGDAYVIDGAKIWTSLGSYAKYMILLARTDPGSKRHSGLSFFLIPMDAPGIRTVPIRKLTGEYGFTQTFFDNARVPADGLMGREGEGWSVAMKTLTFERGAAGGQAGGLARMHLGVDDVVELARRTRRDGRPAIDDPQVREQLVRFLTEAQGDKLTAARGHIPALCSERPDAIPLSMKLRWTEHSRRLLQFAISLQGANAGRWVGDATAVDGGLWQRSYFNAFAATIGGGPSQIQANIVGERVLGLPKD